MRKAVSRSAVTNGARLFLKRGRVTEASRRFGDILESLFAERGGIERMSIAAQEACRSYAGLAVKLEQLHARIALGETVSTAELTKASNALIRARRAMGEPPAKRHAVKGRVVAIIPSAEAPFFGTEPSL